MCDAEGEGVERGMVRLALTKGAGVVRLTIGVPGLVGVVVEGPIAPSLSEGVVLSALTTTPSSVFTLTPSAPAAAMLTETGVGVALPPPAAAAGVAGLNHPERGCARPVVAKACAICAVKFPPVTIWPLTVMGEGIG